MAISPVLVALDDDDLVARCRPELGQWRPDVTGSDDDDVHSCQCSEPTVESLPLRHGPPRHATEP
jgi:hypothetical protein